MEKLNTKITTTRKVFPFTSIIGQEEMKLALLLNVIDPKIGGVMLMGERGTGKSTIVRSLIDILPSINVIEGDLYNSDPNDPELMSEEAMEKFQNNEVLKIKQIKTPMVDLPLGATEDRVCGTIDIEKAISEGKKAFEPGLLAQANRGILYVDEVNLLDDHLVDVLLDSAASGWNTVEREGISICHPAKFILIGSGNPEEGELRPQLLDRFGMHAQIKTIKNPALRVKIVQERELFEKNPEIFLEKTQKEQERLIKKLEEARKIIKEINLSYELLEKISKICSELNVDGLRGDMVTSRASKAFAAFNGRKEVNEKDIYTVITLCLRHRLRKDPLESMDSGDIILKTFKKFVQ
jgi:magnesium chelatase subunit I